MNAILSSLTVYIFFIAIFVNLVFAWIVYASDRKSATNRIFSILSIAVSVWLVAMYSSLGPNSEVPFAIQLTLFFAVPMNMLFFLFVQTLPSPTLRMPKRTLWLLLLGVVVMMGVTISPFVFSSTEIVNNSLKVNPGIGLIFFGLISVVINFGAIFYVLIKKWRASEGVQRKQVKNISLGIALMFGCIIGTIFIPFVFWGNSSFVTFFPLYTLLFLTIAGYTIVQEGLFSVKVLLTEAAMAALLITLLAKIFTSETAAQRALDILVFLGVAIFGIILVKSVRKEVEQRKELEVLNKQIADKNVQLEDLSRFKSELLSLASHQIKSPLAAIKGFASLITDGSYGEVGDRVKETVGKIQRSADELISLINTLLDVRKVEEGKMEYKFERTDLNKMIGGMMELLKPLADAKKLEFSFASPGREVSVNADPEKFKQVIQNLTDNAIKYTPSGFVKVELKVDGAGASAMATVSVSDSGLGIPADLILHLFEEFVRDERVKKEIRGTGLGLYIARKISEAHGGKISAESPGEGKGSTFRIAIPVLQ